MDRRQSSISEAAMSASVEMARQAIRSLPLVSLPESSAPSPGRLIGWESSDDVVTSVEIGYAGSEPDGSWVVVTTARWTGTRARPGPLRWLLEHHLRLQGFWFSDLEWTDGSATMIVDDQPATCQRIRAGTRWWAARCARGDVEVSVVARDWHPDTITLTTVADPESFLDRSTWMAPLPVVPVTATGVASPTPDSPDGDALRVLVDASLRFSEQQVRWWTDGGPPPDLPPQWSDLRKAATRWYAALTDRSMAESERLVDSVADHLANLYHNAAWFRDRPHLRERAISETLLFATDLCHDVSSRRAQEAWQQKLGHPMPTDRRGRDAFVTADLDWLGEWASWAARSVEDV